MIVMANRGHPRRVYLMMKHYNVMETVVEMLRKGDSTSAFSGILISTWVFRLEKRSFPAEQRTFLEDAKKNGLLCLI